MPKDSSSFPRGVRSLFRLPATRERMVRDADAEMQLHVEAWVAEFQARGMTEADARAAAMRRFGDPREYRDHVARRAERKARWESMVDWIAEWRQDVRFALRHFAKTPGFTAIAVATLALGIGANTAIYSVVHRLLIAPLPYPNGDRVVALKTIGRPGFVAGLASFVPDAPSDPSRPLMRAWVARARSFEQIAGVEQMLLAIQVNGQQDTVTYAFATANLLDLLGTRPALGRTFRAEEENKGANHVAMISHRWWQAAYAGRREVLGKILEYEGEKYTIVGVLPVGFGIPMAARALDWLSVPAPDVWMPTRIEETSIGFGLLRPGVSADAATRELNAIANTPEGRGVGDPQQMFIVRDSIRARAMRAQDFVAPRELRTIEILFAAVGALLLIACANVANLLLVRAWTRRREFAVRLGLGAGRARLIRLALTESVLLALAAGAIGLAIAWQGLRVIVALRPLALDRLADVQIEPAILFWTAGISILTGVLFGGAAAFFVASQNVADLLRTDTRTVSGGVSRRVRSALIVAEIALSFALLVCAGLLARSFAALQRTPLGFEPHNLVSLDVLFPPSISRSGQRPVVREAIARRLAEIPGVTAAAFGMLPTAGYAGSDAIEVGGPLGVQRLGIARHMSTWIDPNYFHTSGITLIAGRPPRAGASDEAVGGQIPSPPPGQSSPGTRRPIAVPPPSRTMSEEVVVNRALARRITADGNALNTRIRTVPGPGNRMPASPEWSTIVGIAEDVRLPGSSGDLQDYQLYGLALTRMPTPTYVVRFNTVPPNVESVLRQAVQSVNPTLIARRARVADDYLREALAPTRFALALLAAFAGVALVLAVVGLYGSIAYSVSQRTREIGIRVALGASPKAVVGLVLSDGVRLSIVGLVVGVATAASTTRALSSLLYGVGTSDPMTFATIAAGVATVALAASYMPARRATRVDPVNALRAE